MPLHAQDMINLAGATVQTCLNAVLFLQCLATNRSRRARGDGAALPKAA